MATRAKEFMGKIVRTMYHMLHNKGRFLCLKCVLRAGLKNNLKSMEKIKKADLG